MSGGRTKVADVDRSLYDFTKSEEGYERYADYMVTGNNHVHGGGYDLLTLNARIAPTAWGPASLNLALTNALDEKYHFYLGGTSSPTYATPGPPRQLRATLKVEF